MPDSSILVVATCESARLIQREITPWDQVTPPTTWQFQPRAAVEHDETWLQIIPYVLLTDQHGAVWAYARCGGDGRLWGRYSVGVGGHIEAADGGLDLLDIARACAQRELAEELALPQAAQLDPQPHGWIHERQTAIGRVHLGLVFTARWTALTPPQPKPDEPLAAIGFLSPAAVRTDERFERWSQLAVQLLNDENQPAP